MTPIQRLESFDEKFEHEFGEVGGYNISRILVKQHLIQTVIAVLGERVEVMESNIRLILNKHLELFDGLAPHTYTSGYIEALQHQIDFFTTTLSTWKELLEK